MSFTPQELSEIFHKSGGRCHLCGKALVFAKYGHFGRLGEWELDHVKPWSEGGLTNLANLSPACISCNRSKMIRNRSVKMSSLA